VNSAASFLPKFFVICSVILILTGVAQVFVRPRKERETMLEKLVNRATITAFVTVSFGIVGLLIGLGVLPMVRLGG
jgi:hypothetical protein